MRPGEVLALVKAAGVRPTRKLGQHFLLDEGLLDVIAGAGALTAKDCVLEVGTGPGTLTARLAATGARVVTIDVDPRLADVAREVTGAPDHVTFVHGDALARDGEAIHPALERLLAEAQAEGLSLVCVSNFPYAVATPLVVKMLELACVSGSLRFRRIAGVVQLEVAERFRARAIGKSYGAPSALIQALARVELLRRISPRAFHPPPKVDSALVRIDPLPGPDRIPPARWPAYRDVVRAVFQYRRKTIANALKQGLGLDSARAAEALERAGIDPGDRVERLDVARLRALADAVWGSDI